MNIMFMQSQSQWTQWKEGEMKVVGVMKASVSHLALTSHRHEIRQLKLLIIVIMIHYRLRLI